MKKTELWEKRRFELLEKRRTKKGFLPSSQTPFIN